MTVVIVRRRCFMTLKSLYVISVTMICDLPPLAAVVAAESVVQPVHKHACLSSGQLAQIKSLNNRITTRNQIENIMRIALKVMQHQHRLKVLKTCNKEKSNFARLGTIFVVLVLSHRKSPK